jgi:excisionase family DNA binding protein
MRPRRQALTTGQAATYCFVTAETIANWIRAGLLPAQRTAGGQYRILPTDLREFMAGKGMSTEALEKEAVTRVPCWEFRAGGAAADPRCDECLVQHLKVLDCFKLMAMRSSGGWPARECVDCPYFRRYGSVPGEGGGE